MQALNMIDEYIIYLRKSREDMEKERRTGEDILATHRNRLIELCQRKNFKFTKLEEIESGDTIAGRPEFQKILYEMFPSGRYRGIVVNEMPRLGRGNMKDAGEIYQAIIDYNILVITPHKTYDPKNRADLRAIRMELFLSREEYEAIKDRLADGRDAAARAGRAATNLYTLGLRTIRGNWEIDQKGLDLAEQIFDWVIEGKPFLWIANYLNSLGRKTCRNKPWTDTSVRQVIKNLHYEGYQRWKGEIIQALHGPLLPLEKVYAARDKLIHRDTHSTIKNHQFWAQTLYCGYCGNRMYGFNRKNHYKGKIYTYPTYFCYGRRCQPKCTSRTRAEWIHEKIEEKLWTVVNDRNVQQQLIKQQENVNTEGIEAEIKQCREDVQFNQERIRQIESDYFAGVTDGPTFNKGRAVLEGQIKILQTRIRELEPQIKKKPRSLTEIIKKLEKALIKWDKLPNESKVEIILEYTDRIEFFKRENKLNIKLCLPL